MRSVASRYWLFACLIIATVGFFGELSGGVVQPARAQDDVVADFHETLASYGQWSQHPRWGEVWIPANMPANWAPYRYGHWAYTEEWGWYWVSDEDFGWITYHYGRWFPDPELGWVWVPGTEWSPAWVSWRRGDEALGWAPMPPDEVIDEYEDRPEVWCFVRLEEIFAPRVGLVAFPRAQGSVFVQRTVLVNRTVFAQQGSKRVVANPGIPPSYIASKIGRPIQTVAIQPHVVRGTIGVAGAVVGGPATGVAFREISHPQTTLIQPATLVPPPVRFQPSHASLGPDAPNALRRMQTSPSGLGTWPTTSGASGKNLQQGSPPSWSVQSGNAQHSPQGPSGSVQGNLQPQPEFRRTPLPPPAPLAKPAPPPPQAAKPPPPAPQAAKPRPIVNGRDTVTNGM